jgi:hypothetical protein
VPDELRDKWRDKGTPRDEQIYETLRRGFRVKAHSREDLKWLFRDQRNAALHPRTGFDVPQPHPLGVNTAAEYTIYTSEHAQRCVDVMLDVLATCVGKPRDALRAWAADARAPVQQLVATRRS